MANRSARRQFSFSVSRKASFGPLGVFNAIAHIKLAIPGNDNNTADCASQHA